MRLPTREPSSKRRPQAPAVNASHVTIRTGDGRPLPLQADGDLIGSKDEWTFEVRPAAVRMIGRW